MFANALLLLRQKDYLCLKRFLRFSYTSSGHRIEILNMIKVREQTSIKIRTEAAAFATLQKDYKSSLQL